jgi:hypothetical protein
MAQQIRSELQAVTWPGGSAVFGSTGQNVAIFAGEPSEEQIPARFPWALVGIGSGDADPDDPQFLTQQFEVIVAANVMGDVLGEQAVSGGPSADLNKSAGRGVAELAERARAAVEDLTGADGAKILLSSQSMQGPRILAQRHLAFAVLTLSGLCTSAKHYAAPQELTRVSTTWTWKGAHCSDRYDFRRYTLGYRAGSVPAPTLADLTTIVYQGTAPTTTHTMVVGQVYSAIAEYSARKQSGVTEGSSAGNEVGAFLVT